MKKKSPRSLEIFDGDINSKTFSLFFDKALQVDTETDGLDFRKYKLEVITLADLDSNVVMIRHPWSCKTNLSQLLESQRTTKFFHHADFDLRFIKAWTGIEVYGDIECTKTLMKIVHPELESSGLGSSLKNILGLKIDKKIDHRKWKNEKYSARQKEYMAGDVLYLYDLYKKLETELASRDMNTLLRYTDIMDFIRIKAFAEVEGFLGLWEYRQPTPKESLTARLWWQEQKEKLRC
jgi:ribonuclease D